MSQEVEPYRVPAVVSWSGRSVGRSLSRLELGTGLRLARLEADAEVQAAKAASLAYVGRQAMQDVALVSQLEQQLATTVPMASGRLAAIADLTALGMSEVVAESASKLRRM